MEYYTTVRMNAMMTHENMDVSQTKCWGKETRHKEHKMDKTLISVSIENSYKSNKRRAIVPMQNKAKELTDPLY